MFSESEAQQAYYRGLDAGFKNGVKAGKYELAKELVIKKAEMLVKNHYTTTSSGEEKERNVALLELDDLVHQMWLYEPTPF